MLPISTDLKTLVLPGATPVQHFKIAGMFEDEYCALPEEFKPFYEYDEENRQYTLNELEWLRWRKHGPYHRHPDDARYIKHTLGGSDIAALFDGSALSKSLHLYDGQHGSNYKCKMELYYEKIEKNCRLRRKKTPIYSGAGIMKNHLFAQFSKNVTVTIIPLILLRS